MSSNFPYRQSESLLRDPLTVRIPPTTFWPCLVSFLLHGLFLIFMGLISFPQTQHDTIQMTSVIEDQEPPTYLLETIVADDVGNDSKFNNIVSSSTATHEPAKPQLQQIERTIAAGLRVALPVSEDVLMPLKSDLLTVIGTRGATEYSGGVQGAVDRLAVEIAASLRENKTLVVWLFDASPSLYARRAEIADRIENVYRQVTSLNAESDKILKSAVVAFGEKPHIVTKEPLHDAGDLVRAIRNITSESSGLENTFSAVKFVAKHYQPERVQMHRNIMIVIVTDEAGSDPESLEQAIVATKQYGMRCYCVGDAAPFGKQVSEAPFVLENGESVIGVMHRGPETFFPERLRLAYWGRNDNDLEEMSSGFGPYGLTRLCTETNGLYLLTDDNRGHRFDSQVMRNYMPDYRPIRVLEMEITHNKAQKALRDACALCVIDSVPSPRLEFPADNDATLRQVLIQSQRPLTEFEYKLDALLQILEPGEKDRSKIKDSRSQAGFDLAMGRVLALRTRSHGYNVMLAEMKLSPKRFEKKDSNLWRLEPSEEITTGSVAKKMAERAKKYLDHVIDAHPGTPWQLMAERERKIPLGWQWKESSYVPVAKTLAETPKNTGPKFVDPNNGLKGTRNKTRNDNVLIKREI